MEKINLKEIIESLDTFDKDYPTISIEDAKVGMLEFGKQLLELAAENAVGEIKRSLLNPTKPTSIIELPIVNKQSILDAIKQVE